MTKREFLAAGIGAAGLALTQSRPTPAAGIPRRKAKTTPLFKAPDGFPNGLSAKPEGLWIGEQKMAGDQAKRYGVPEPDSLDEAAWLVDWNGKLKKTVMTPCRNCSGMAVGGGYVWMIANREPHGVFQVDMDGKLISHRQIPFGMPGKSGGGNHGGLWHEGKLWIAALRLRANVLIDPETWQVDHMIPFYRSEPDWVRYHGIAIHDGSLWQVVGNQSTSPANFKPGLVRYSLETGQVQEIIEFLPGSGDPHALAFHDGKFITCDAGIHPGWKTGASPTAGWILQVDFV